MNADGRGFELVIPAEAGIQDLPTTEDAEGHRGKEGSSDSATAAGCAMHTAPLPLDVPARNE